MASESEPAKLLLPYLQRADELQKHEPLVAYYCRLYAMEQGLKIPQSDRTKTTNALLVSLMNQLEKDKKSIKLGPDDHLHVEGFALNVFSKADKQDRGGRADLNTAKTFYAASIFFEILNQFGELQPELEQKQKYAVWKAADIRKALKEGRKPVPGPPGGEDDLSVPSSTSSGEYDLQPSRNNFPDSATRTDLNRTDSAARTTLGSDSPPQQYDHDNLQQSTNFSRLPSNITPPHSSPPANYPTDSYTQVDSSARTAPHPDSSPQIYDHDNIHHSSSFSQSPSNDTPPPSLSIHSSHYPTENYPSESIPQPPSGNNSEHSIYHHSYHHQPYQSEPQSHFHQQFPTQDTPPYSYPNFQSYPSFTESTLPAAPSHYPSYYQGSDASYSGLSPSNAAPYASTPQYNSSGRNGNVPEASPPATEKYEYDSSYQPPPEKIAEAHKAARFAVGALAFDDVSTAVDHLKKSLELLTNPSAAL